MKPDNPAAFPDEHWKDIEGFKGYTISNYGRIFSFKRKKRILMKLQNTQKGYKKVVLRKNGKKINILIAPTVLETFRSKRPSNFQCCHNDGNRINNHIDNLRWDTASNNTKDQVKHMVHVSLKRNGENSHLHKLTTKEVSVIKGLLELGFECKRIADFMILPRTTISNIKHGVAWQHLDAPYYKKG